MCRTLGVYRRGLGGDHDCYGCFSSGFGRPCWVVFLIRGPCTDLTTRWVSVRCFVGCDRVPLGGPGLMEVIIDNLIVACEHPRALRNDELRPTNFGVLLVEEAFADAPAWIVGSALETTDEGDGLRQPELPNTRKLTQETRDLRHRAPMAPRCAWRAIISYPIVRPPQSQRGARNFLADRHLGTSKQTGGETCQVRVENILKSYLLRISRVALLEILLWAMVFLFGLGCA